MKKTKQSKGVFKVDYMKTLLPFTLSDLLNVYTIGKTENYTLLHFTKKSNQ